MTREEKQKAIDALKKSAPVMAVTQEEFNDYIQTLNKVMDWLEQETVSKESYDHEYFLRKELEIKIAKLEQQEPILDKIRVEIENVEINGHIRDVECFNAGINTALNIIDKYREEQTDAT